MTALLGVALAGVVVPGWIVQGIVGFVFSWGACDLAHEFVRGRVARIATWLLLVLIWLTFAVPAHSAPIFVRHGGRVTIQVATAAPVTLGYTVPAFQSLPGECDGGSQPAHVDSVRLIAWRRMPDPFDAAAWRNAQLAGWETPYTVRTKHVRGLAGLDTLRCPALPLGTTVALIGINAAGQSCVSNLCRGANP